MISINEVQDEVIAEFNDFDDWMDRYQLLIDLGNEQEPLDEKYKTEQNLIERLPEPRMAAGRRSGRKNYFPGRKRRTDCERNHFTAYQSTLRAHTG